MRLVLSVSFPIFYRKRISVNIQHLQILELGLLFSRPSEVGEYFFKGPDEVVADRKDVQLIAVVETVNEGDLIVIEGEVG